MKLNKWNLLIATFFLAVALSITWPLITNLNGFLLPQEYTNIWHSDTMQHISKIDESRQQLRQRGDPFVVDSTDVSQLYVFLGLISTSVHVDAAVYHNLFFIAVIFLSGFFMYLLAFELTKSKYAALLAGFIYASSYYIPYAYYWGHSNTMQIEWIPLIFLLVEKISRTGQLKYSIWLGVAIALQVFSGSQNTVYLTFIIPFYLTLTHVFNGKISKEVFKKMGSSVILALAITGYYDYRKITTPSIVRTVEENMNIAWRLNSLQELVNINDHLFIGLVQFALLVVAVYLIIRKYKEYKQYAPFVIIFLFVLLCMFGPFSIFAPYYWLYKFWPLVNSFRVPFRMFPFMLLALSVLCAVPIVGIDGSKMKGYVPYIIVATLLLLTIQNQLSPWLANLHIYMFPS